MSKKKKQQIEQNELVDVFNRKYEQWKPYLPVVLSVAGVVLAIVVGTVWYFNNQAKKRDARWAELSDAIRQAYSTEGGNSGPLLEFADDYPDTDAALWAQFVAGDIELNEGSTAGVTNKKETADRYRAAKEILRKVIDSERDKDKMLHRRAIYSLAYAHEGLGEFDEAQKLYQQLVDEGKDSPLYATALRGVSRTSNQDIRDFYTLYANWSPLDSDAPGTILPNVPDISFPEFPTKPDTGGGQFSLPDITDGKNLDGKNDPTKKKDSSEDKAPRLGDKKGDDKKGDDKKGDDKKGDDTKGDDTKGNDTKGNDTKGEDKKGEDKKGEDKKGEDKKGEDKKGEDKKGEDKKGEDKKGEDKKSGGQ